MRFLEINWLQTIAILFLLGALGNNPYDYYHILRWIVSVTSIYSAYSAYTFRRKIWMAIFSLIAILFNPIASFYLSKDIWKSIDVIVAIIFIVYLSQKYERKN